nr:RRP12-like protein isoform X1 [Ipomoea batatas]
MAMENQRELPDAVRFNEKSDICKQLLDRYGKSSAAQHRHLCATAAATRSIIQSESLPLTPFSYFAATASTLSDSSNLDSDALVALSSFLSIVLPLVPEKAIVPPKATEAVGMLAAVLERQPLDDAAVGSSSARALVKCLGILLGFCDLEEWDSVKLGLETLLKFSIDRRPKVRKCAHECALTVIKSLQSSSVIKRASKFVYSFVEGHMSLAIKMSAPEAVDGFKDDCLSKSGHQEVLHTLNLMKTIAPHLSVKVRQKVLTQLLKLMSSRNSDLTRHVFDNVGVILDTPKVEMVAPDSENILKLLVSYMSCLENPTDNILAAATLAKQIIKKLYASEISGCSSHLDLVIGSITGLLTSEATALPALSILKELIELHADNDKLSPIKKQMVDDNDADNATNNPEFAAVKSICSVFNNLLRSSDGIPNEHILRIVSVLFLKLGEISYFSMKDILLKLADWMNVSCGVNGASNTKYLQECIGSATIAMGPDKLLALLPISVSVSDYSCSNTWLIPILSKYVIQSTLAFFMEHIVPLAESFQHASFKVKKSVIGQELQAYAHDCWGLLPAFCRGPTDIHQNFGALSKLLIPFLKKDSFILEKIAASLKELVNQNKNLDAHCYIPGAIRVLLENEENKDFATDFKKKCSYSKKAAEKNIRAMCCCSKELLQALTDVLIESYPETHEYLKEAIECLASITDSENIKNILISSLERFGLATGTEACEMLEDSSDCKPDQGEGGATSVQEDANRCLILELTSCLIEGANDDLILIIFSIAKRTFEVNDEIVQAEAYNILSRMLEKHPWFRSLHFVQSMELLIGVKSPTNIKSLTSRFSCFKTLLIHVVEENMDEENPQVFLILNEIILALKESNEEGRKIAYEVLIGICSYLRNSSSPMSHESYKNFITMVMGYLSGPSPHIKSGAVSALSVLIYNDTDICQLVPDLVPSVLTLLQSKGVEIIKAVLGFVKVLVSSLQSKDLEIFLPDIVNGVLPWSSTSRHHFRSKVSVVMEILSRKCGTATIKSIATEKYGNFLKTISENRHGKTSFKEAATSTSSKSSFKGQQKRCHGESSNVQKDESISFPRKRKWERRQKGFSGNLPEEASSLGTRKRKRDFNKKADLSTRKSESSGRELVKRAGEFGPAKQKWGGSSPHRNSKKRNFSHDARGGNRTPRNKADSQHPDAVSNFSKHKKFQKKRQKRQ